MQRLRVQLGGEALRGRHAVAFLDQVGYLVPLHALAEANPDPPLRPNLGGHVEAVRPRLNQRGLHPRPRLARHSPVADVIAGYREDLLADPEGSMPPGLALGRLGQGEADLAQPLQFNRDHD